MRFEFTLAGPAGEPIDLWRILVSHGVAHLSPMTIDEDARALKTTVALPRGRPRTIVISKARSQTGARVEILGPRLRDPAPVTAKIARILNLEEDLSGFYEVAAGDPELAWATAGAGRMLRSPTVFEDVVKTICTLITTSPFGDAPQIGRTPTRHIDLRRMAGSAALLTDSGSPPEPRIRHGAPVRSCHIDEDFVDGQERAQVTAGIHGRNPRRATAPAALAACRLIPSCDAACSKVAAVRFCGLASAAGLVATVALAVGIGPASGASARRADDPCAGNARPHVNQHGLHCGGVVEIPGHRTLEVPNSDAAPNCDRNTEEIAGAIFGDPSLGDWDFWSKNGEWVTWDGQGHYRVGAHGQPINELPSFHNWGSSPWQVRVFFRCVRRY